MRVCEALSLSQRCSTHLSAANGGFELGAAKCQGDRM